VGEAFLGTARITTAALLKRHAPLWKVTCRNPFVGGVRDGSLPVEVFDRWLVQHQLLADRLFTAICRIAAAAPDRDRPVLLEILRTMSHFLPWFDRMLSERGLDSNVPMHPVCRAYADYTVALGFEPYPVALVALWTQLRAYRDAWKWAHPGAPKFRGVVSNFYSPAYEPVQRELSRAADAALAEASRREVQRAEQAVLDVAKYELAFWVMTMKITDKD
jgi:formylaminopyrimidine deformylase / aminopyrimidine aminohydrolase